MTRQIQIDIPQGVNLLLLREELRTAVGEYVAGVSCTPDAVYVVVEDDALDDIADQMQAIIAAHDPAQLTATQAAGQNAVEASIRVKAIPGWATWDEDTALEYITDNVTDLASAKVVIKALARIVIALRDATWPLLNVDV